MAAKSPADTFGKDVGRIQPNERDRQLGLDDSPTWPAAPPSDAWTLHRDHYLYRDLPISPEDRDEPAPFVDLREMILRFPSAPIHGIHRIRMHHAPEQYTLNFHTYRILTAKRRPAKIKRIYLLHNGLDEVKRVDFYYQLAARLIQQDASVACVLRPFPRHLTRAQSANYSEKSLDRYLWDGSYLFRQFLRYMVETQWFLSALVTRSRYRCPSGIALLADNRDPKLSRLNASILAHAMREAWLKLHRASSNEEERRERCGWTNDGWDSTDDRPSPRPGTMGLTQNAPPEQAFRQCIASLRHALKLKNYPERADDPPDGAGDLEPGETDPSVHVVGYSLGGFVAQSVFMSWPFLISTCSTLLSGGALRELSPTAFAHPEEWQTVLHSLRYELDDALLDGRFGADTTQPAGLSSELFHSFQRTFYEVFEQEYQGSFQSRLTTFRRRMLFVLGGDDPIVKPSSVLDSAPPGGVNLLEIGGLGHFVGQKAQNEEEAQQRSFWIPEVARVIDRFATEAASQHLTELRASWLDQDLEVRHAEDARVTRLSEEERLAVESDGALTAELFDIHLSDLLARRIKDAGLLIIARTELPTMLLTDKAVQQRARSLYHDDGGIVSYCQRVKTRRDALRASGKGHVQIVLPWNVRMLFDEIEPESGFPSQAEATVGLLSEETKVSSASWNDFTTPLAELVNDKPESVLIFDGRDGLEARQAPRHSRPVIANVRSTSALRVLALPDCWVWVSEKAFRRVGSRLRKQSRVSTVIGWFIEAACEPAGCRALAECIQRDELRVITVSRARYNPRLRGKVIVEPSAAEETLMHLALCLATAYSYGGYDLKKGSVR